MVKFTLINNKISMIKVFESFKNLSNLNLNIDAIMQ